MVPAPGKNGSRLPAAPPKPWSVGGNLTGSAASMQKRPVAAAILTSLLLTGTALAADPAAPIELPTERYNLRASGFFAQDIDTKIRVDGHLNAGGQEWDFGTTIDMAEQLKLETSVEVFRGEAMWSFGRSQRLDFEWFNMEERGRVNLGEAIDFGDTDFAAGLNVDSYFRTNIFRLSYTYFVIQKPRTQLGLSLGVHLMKVNTGISVTGTSLAETGGVTAPLPVLGLSFNYALTNRLLLRAHGEYLTISYDKYEGELIDLYGALEWRLNHHWSVGGGLEYFDINVVTHNDRLRIDVEHDWTGFQAYLSFRF